MIKRFVRRMVTGLLAVSLALGAQLVAPALLPTSALATASAADPLPGLVPTFTAAGYSGDNGFVFYISNYDAAYDWTVSVPIGLTSTIRLPGNGRPYSVAIRGVPLDQSATIVVTTTRSGYADGSASFIGYAKKTGITPTFGTPIPTYFGFSVQVTNYSPDYSWFVAADYGAATIDANGLVSVTGIYDSTTSTVNVTPSRPDYSSNRVDIVGTVLPPNPAYIPTFGEPTLTQNSIIVQITNYDSAYTWAVDPGGDGIATIDDNGLVTVTDLYDGETVNLRVTPTRFGYLSTATVFVATSLIHPLTPAIDGTDATADGFTMQLNNYDSSYAWTVSCDYGSATIDSSGLITVTGLTHYQSATVTVSSERSGTEPGSASFSGNALKADYTPTFGNVTRTTGGFTVPITNYEPAFDWSVYTESATGSSSIDSSGLVTVTGLYPGQQATLHALTSRATYNDSDVWVTSSALDEALVPLISTATPVDGGFQARVTNFDSSYTWSVSGTAGSASISNSGFITVSGLASSQAATVTVSNHKDGFTSGSASLDGVAATAPVAPPIVDPATEQNAEALATEVRKLAEQQAADRILQATQDAIKAKNDAKAAAEAQVQALAAAKLATDLKAVATLTGTSGSAVAVMLKTLTPTQIGLIPIATFKSLSPVAVKAISPIQAAALTPGQVRSLNVKSLIKLTPAAIGSLKAEALGALSVAKLKALTKAQVKAIWFGQLHELDQDQRKAIRR